MLPKIVVPAAGMGTRLLSITKEIPKEMLPLFSKKPNGLICLKPIVQLVFEQFFDCGFREFCFVVGRGKRTIEDHFSPDHQYLRQLKTSGKTQESIDLEEFYMKIEESTIVWVNQPTAKGFGDAVLQAKSFTNNEPFIVHAGDTYIASNDGEHIQQIIPNTEKDVDTTLCLLKVTETEQYGIAEITGAKPLYNVKKVIEKPENPPTNLAIMPIYLFNDKIYEALKSTTPGKNGEVQLTDGIQKLIEWNHKVVAYELKEALHLDIGTPRSYWNAQRISYNQIVNDQDAKLER